MDNFKELTLSDKDLFNNYLRNFKNSSYEYSFAALYLWRDLCKTKYSIINDCLIIKKETPDGIFFMMPIGYNKSTLQELILKLKDLSTNDNVYLLGDIEDSFIYDLETFTDIPFKIVENRDTFEYIYLTNDLLKLEGKKYHQKKNHYNSFINSYNYTVTSIDNEEKINDCLELLSNWHLQKPSLCNELQIETKEITDLLYNLNYLDLYSICVYVENSLVGFSIGEIFKDTAIIHIERCNINYKGVYSFINREFIKRYFSKTTYINRQEDCGCIGLRKSKLSYKPLYLLKKSLIIV